MRLFDVRSKLGRRAMLVAVVLGTALLSAALALAGATALILLREGPHDRLLGSPNAMGRVDVRGGARAASHESRVPSPGASSA